MLQLFPVIFLPPNRLQIISYYFDLPLISPLTRHQICIPSNGVIPAVPFNDMLRRCGGTWPGGMSLSCSSSIGTFSSLFPAWMDESQLSGSRGGSGILSFFMHNNNSKMLKSGFVPQHFFLSQFLTLTVSHLSDRAGENGLLNVAKQKV